MRVPAQRKLKVARIIARLNVGGPARQACALHHALQPDLDTLLITGRVDAGEADMSYLLRDHQGVHWVDTMSRPVRFWADVQSFWRICRILRRERPDIVHTHTAKAGAIGRIAAWLAGVPHIVHTYHGHVFEGYFSAFKSRIYRVVEKALGAITTRIITISPSQQRDICGRFKIVPENKTDIVRTGHNLAPFLREYDVAAIRAKLGIPADKFLVVWAGRMAPIKDMGLLAETIRATAAQNIHFLIVGEGAEAQLFLDRMRGCANYARIGWWQQMEEVWAAADAALLTSHNEGTPASLIEAMASGKPFVSTDVGGVSDLVVEPWSAAPVPGARMASNCFVTERTAEALAGCIEWLAKNPAKVKNMGTAARLFALANYDQAMMIAKHRELIAELCEQHARTQVHRSTGQMAAES